MEDNYLNELEQQKQAVFERQQVLDRMKNIRIGKKRQIPTKPTGQNKIKQIKKTAKIWLAIAQIIISLGLDLSGWALLFKENKVVGVLLLSVYLIIIIAIVALIVTIIMSVICLSLGSWGRAVVSWVSDDLNFCSAF